MLYGTFRGKGRGVTDTRCCDRYRGGGERGDRHREDKGNAIWHVQREGEMGDRYRGEGRDVIWHIQREGDRGDRCRGREWMLYGTFRGKVRGVTDTGGNGEILYDRYRWEG